MKRWPQIALLALALFATGCKERVACRPGTVFVKLTMPAGAAKPDKLAIVVEIEGALLTASLPYTTGDTLEVELAQDKYVVGKTVVVTVRGILGEDELWLTEKPLTLPASCGTLELAVDSVADLSGVVPGDGGEPRDLTPGPPDLARKPLGAMCATAGECASDKCVDGYCCNDSCNGQCEACDIAGSLGTCVTVPSGPPHGARGACAGTGVCVGTCGGTVRSACAYPGVATICRTQSCTGSTRTNAAGCDGAGACSAVTTLTCTQGCSGADCLGACLNDTECATADPTKPYCDAGVCTPKKPRGRTCAAGTECTSTFCADGYCCNVGCTAQCDSCKEAGALGTCQRRTGAPITGGTPARTACVGSGVCQGACDGVAASCVVPGSSTACGAQSCTSGTLTPVGSCSGGSCSQPTSPCPNGNCSGNACGPCSTHAQCGSGRWCNGGTCANTLGNGAGCGGVPEACTSGNCVSDAAGTATVCCGSACSGSTPRCNTAFTGCTCTATSCTSPATCFNSACCTPSCPACRKVSVSNGCGGTCGPNCSGFCCDFGCSGSPCP